MWLPKDERDMLLIYYKHLNNTRETRKFINLSEKACNATDSLLSHKLVRTAGFGNERIITSLFGEEKDLAGVLTNNQDDVELTEIILRLTQEGLDLARKYDNWFERSGLWFADHRYHWIWPIILIVLTAIASFIVGRLTKP